MILVRHSAHANPKGIVDAHLAGAKLDRGDVTVCDRRYGLAGCVAGMPPSGVADGMIPGK